MNQSELKYSISTNNLHIEDSWKVRKKEMGVILEHIKMTAPTPSLVWNRTMFSLRMEWCVHNALYSLDLWRSRTKDVDLNYPNRYEWLYEALGCLVWLFVR